ncbi:MAG: FAD-binding oxidoreductase [Candidatus Latescibacterota bacterium]|nr:MAG: FAD-binding oxidoreductase [Candidatus Latescibacterota bacterium]
MTSGNTYDLVIIGAGSIGVPVALYAQRSGLSTLVLDKQPSAGQGEAKTAIGGIRATHSDPAKIRICLRSIDVFSEWEDREGDDLGWRKGGYLFPIYTEKDETTLKGLLDVQKSHGLNIDWIGPEEVAKLVPGIRREDLCGGTYSPDDGNASPLKCTAAFSRVARREGAEFRFNETVTGIEVEKGRVTGVVTDKGEYPCKHVLNAAGSNAPEMGRPVGIELPVNPDSHEAGVTEPVERLFDPLIVDIRVTPGSKNCYFYQNSANQIVFCLTPDPISPGTNRDSTAMFLPVVSKKMVDLLPKLSNLRVRRVWRGCYPQTPDGMPIVGSSREIAGYHYAVGLCGQGFMLGPGLAEDVVSLIRTGKPVTDEKVFESFRLDRDFAVAEALR